MSKPFCQVSIRRRPNSDVFYIGRCYRKMRGKLNVYCVTESPRDAKATEVGRMIGNAIAAEIQRRMKPKKGKA